jgi:hypothetical protein
LAATVEFIVDQRASALEILAEPYPHRSRSAVQLDPADPFALAALAGATLPHLPAQRADDIDSLFRTLAASEDDMGPWVLLVPADLQRALIGIDGARLYVMAETWRDSYQGWSTDSPPEVDDVAYLLKVLIEKAREAELTGSCMLMYVML